ncbi:hypothetical protein [Ornithinimicrobium pekingense]|uniref:ATP-grasp domain-containing protein n=1 Tax=Ornithinimicrobium pekingense TaxID=384677 RepID=A0ABQ2F881_9MICO|nr:hypothetical protein [Ornithinimicrobium pekingense]GGK71066.1 hypothetical protein GCM10011509_19350 [Ornithinimicrobium pekingense]
MTRAREAPRRGPVVILGGTAVQVEAVHAAHALGREAHAVTTACADAVGAAADEVALMDLADVDAVTRYAQHVGAAAVYSVGSDEAMPVVAEVTERLGLLGLVGRRTVDLCRHEHQLRAVLAGAPGAPASPERVPGPDISVTGFLWGGELVFVGVSDRDCRAEDGDLVHAHTFPSRSADCLEVHEAVVVLDAACQRIGLLDGPVHARMVVGPDGVRLTRLSPRLDGCHLWRLWREVTGVDLLTAAVAGACGERPALAVPDGAPLVPVWPRSGDQSVSLDPAEGMAVA